MRSRSLATGNEVHAAKLRANAMGPIGPMGLIRPILLCFMKIIFFGTSNVALPILEMLHQHHDIAAVITQPDALVGRKKELTESPVSVLAHEMELKIFKPESLKNNGQLLEDLQKLAADIFIVVSYG